MPDSESEDELDGCVEEKHVSSRDEEEVNETELMEDEVTYGDSPSETLDAAYSSTTTQDSPTMQEESETSGSCFSPGGAVDMFGKQPVDFLPLFLTEEIIDRIVAETKKYANDYIDSHILPPNSRVRKWKPCTIN